MEAEPQSTPHESIHTKDHLVSVTNIYHRRANGQINAVHTRFTAILNDSEDAYQREYAIGERWEEVSLSWVNQPPSCLIIEVTAGGGVDIGVRDDITGNTLETQYVQSGQSTSLLFPQKVYVRSRMSAQTRIRVTAIPH